MNGLRIICWIVGVLMGGPLPAQPDKATTDAANPAGLKGEYFNGPNFGQKVLTRTDPQVAFDWNGRSPAPGVQREYFSVRWTGKIYAPVSGTYQFSATADDGVRVWVNGKKVIDEWRKQDDSQFVGEIMLRARQSYDLKVEYYNDWKGSIIYLFWKIPDAWSVNQSYRTATKMYEMIPAYYLSPKSIRRAVVSLPAQKPVTTARPKSVLAAGPVKRSVPAAMPPDSAKRVAVTVDPVSPPPASEGIAPKPSEKLIRLVAGETVVMRNVFFKQSEYTLLPTSYAELNNLLRSLQANPAVRVEVAGHTDNVGDPRLNRALSENRAKVVANYLIRRGIAETRIRASGYGSTQPVADNASEDGRGKNRRVEIIIR